jgi:transcription antitermination factor NusG
MADVNPSTPVWQCKEPSRDAHSLELLGDSLRKWYAAYTRSRHEKNVKRECERRAIECFLPTYEAVRRWKDRLKRVELPLFPGYIFVRIASLHRLNVLQIPSVVCLVGINGKPTPLREEEIEALQRGVLSGLSAKPHPYLVTGRRVRILVGALAGSEGVLIRRKGNLRIVLSIDLLRRSIAVDADIADVEPVSDISMTAVRGHIGRVSH